MLWDGIRFLPEWVCFDGFLVGRARGIHRRICTYVAWQFVAIGNNPSFDFCKCLCFNMCGGAKRALHTVMGIVLGLWYFRNWLTVLQQMIERRTSLPLLVSFKDLVLVQVKKTLMGLMAVSEKEKQCVHFKPRKYQTQIQKLIMGTHPSLQCQCQKHIFNTLNTVIHAVSHPKYAHYADMDGLAHGTEQYSHALQPHPFSIDQQSNLHCGR